MASLRARSLYLLENSALASSTLLVKCSSTTCKESVIAFFADDLSRTPYRCPPPHKETKKQRTNKLASLLPARASVLHARSLLPSNQHGPIYIHTYICLCLSVQVRGWKRACTLVACPQDVPLDRAAAGTGTALL